ncbi:hypothetical protein CAEBREN_20360 [Caenorhabditis brenneri]|uniref:Uncharacterized protein n=1 Tax=Caenorhabditis brenneri TaxID=135651 RepID=G0MH36_CAEBE|nr:hypothetical protein CAEBREN_20360 [Caenorhabditis brenneri]
MNRGLTPPQELISFLINSAVGLTATSRQQFDTVFRDAKPGEPDTLVCLCIKWLFKNGDFSEFHEDIARLVRGRNLASYSDGRLMHCPELIKLVFENAVNRTRKTKFAIGKDEFSICAGRTVLLKVPFTSDMDEPATVLAEFTQVLYSFSKYDIEYAFEGNYGIGRNMDLTQSHIKLLSKLTPDLFAEKGKPRVKRERNGRLQVRMTRISQGESGIYYNAILDLFRPLRATIIVQGEFPLCKQKVSYLEILEHTLANPGVHLRDKNATLTWMGISRQRRRVE